MAPILYYIKILGILTSFPPKIRLKISISFFNFLIYKKRAILALFNFNSNYCNQADCLSYIREKY